MNLTPDDRALAQHFVACMDDRSATTLTLAVATEDHTPSSASGKWQGAVLLVAMVRKLGWTPPKETIDTPA